MYGYGDGLEEAVHTIKKGNHNGDYLWMDALNIYVEIEYLIKSLPIKGSPDGSKGQFTINFLKFFQTICNDINKAFGSVNNLTPILDEETNTFKIM